MSKLIQYKAISLLVCVLLGGISTISMGLGLPVPVAKEFDLMKCTAPKHGILFGSFAHLRNYESEKVTYLPQDIVYVHPSGIEHLKFTTFSRDPRLLIDVSSSLVKMVFQTTIADQKMNHVITLVHSDFDNPNSYMGNWAMGESSDLVSCTLN